jgi:hypothetical protein
MRTHDCANVPTPIIIIIDKLSYASISTPILNTRNYHYLMLEFLGRQVGKTDMTMTMAVR